MSDLTQSKEIDGMQFAVTKLGGRRGLKVLKRLGTTVGVAIVKALATAQSEGATSFGNANVSIIGDGLAMLSDRLSDDEMDWLIDSLLETARVKWEGKDIQLLPAFDIVMQGRAHTSLKLLKFAIEVNYGSFLTALLSAASMTAGQELASSSPNS